MKMNFDNFQMQNWVPKQLGLQRQMKKIGVICLVFMSPSWVMILKLWKIISFLQFFGDASKKSKAVIVMYMHPEFLGSLFLENGIDYYQTWVWSVDLRISTFCILSSRCVRDVLKVFHSCIFIPKLSVKGLSYLTWSIWIILRNSA